MSEKLKKLISDWEKKHQRDFEQERKPEGEFACSSGIVLKSVYTPTDLE